MNADRFDRIQDLFFAALDRPREDRAAFLDHACPDAGLRRAVEAYLAADTDADPFLLDEPLVHLSRSDEIGEAEVEGRQVGPYRLVRLLGRGGMGAVYLAEREDVERPVALKLVRGDLADPVARQRFLFERRILARLEHPGIARLYDVGVADDGTPFFAMEVVEGEPLTDYCDRERLGVEDRLRVFERVGRAVQHAHQHFVVHRDLKPSNVLVTPEGEVKLLDFGIAKLMAETDDETGLATATGRRLLTPAYAAPEQVTGEAVTAATDVYSLGVMLYELLTGQRPYEVGDTGAQAVLTEEPSRPSTVVTDTASTNSTPAEARQTTPDRLARRLRGDLDVICLKALQKEPERRYASAEAFVEDVKRHLAELPVTARPDSPGYRLRKFAQRHRQGVLASGAAFVLLALVVGFYTVRLQAERDRALTEAMKAEEVTGFLLSLFEASHPNEAQGDTLTARDLLARGVRRAEGLAQQPDVRIAMLGAVGQAYHGLALYAAADSVLAEALAAARAAHGPEHPAVARALSDLALVKQSTERFDEADALFRTALAMQQRLDTTDPLDLAETLWRYGRFETRMSKPDSARQHVEESLALRRATLGDVHPAVAQSLLSLAVLEAQAGKHERAEALHREALSVRRATLGDAHLDLSTSLVALGTFLREKGDHEAADSLLTEALAMNRRLVGEVHPHVAGSLSNLAVLREYEGDVPAAESLHAAALAIYATALGPDHLSVAATLENMGRLKQQAGDLDAADSLLRRVLVLRRRKLGEDHASMATMYTNLGVLLRKKEQYAEAEAFHRRALAIDEKLDVPQFVALDLLFLGNVRKDRGDVADAEAHYRRALTVQRTELPAGHRDVASTLHILGHLLNEQDRFAEAEPLLREAVAIRRDTYGDDDYETAWSRVYLGVSVTGQGRYEEAEALLQQSYAHLLAAQGASETQRERTRGYLADLYEAWGRPDEARGYRTIERP